MALHDKLANKAIRSGKHAADFNIAAHQHAKVSWVFLITAGAIWYFFGWRWALIPGALGILTLFQSISAAMIAERIEKVWQKTSGVNNVEISDDVMSIIEAYKKILINSAPTPGCVADVSKLPYPKQKIKTALIAVLKIIKDPQIKEHLKIAYILLKDWQEGVGESDQGLDLSKIDPAQSAEALAATISKQFIGEKDWGKITLEEQEKLVHELQELGLWDNMIPAEKIAELDVKKQGITIETYKQMIKLNPDYAEAHCGLGIAYYDLGRYQEAIEALKQAIRLKPDHADAHNNLGVVFKNLGRHQEAIEAYKQAIKLNPDYAAAHYNLGVVYYKLSRDQEAIDVYKQAIKVKPDYAAAYNNLGLAYSNLNRFLEAIDAYKQAIKVKPDLATAHYNLGNAYYDLGRHKEAIEAYKQAIKVKPDDAEAHMNLGLTYMAIGDKGSALEEYKILKTLDPERATELLKLINKYKGT